MRFAPILALVAVAAAAQTPVVGTPGPVATPGPHTNGTKPTGTGSGSGSEPSGTDGVPSPNGAVSFGAKAGLAGAVGAVAVVLAL
ncbi:hypothetical protein N0V84_007646 [Fusarium piperis]|uniref:Uncharacterized protein n=1 Tax=Fusarium piperis TaxID=1435070 RepID=A0A9W8W9R0_9HYPO|nr:hypothetical protein N0V84_007646 [Fusarium piperis]